jgi:phosphoribosyl 1,2-cyclic phosphate phosphodiesterase
MTTKLTVLGCGGSLGVPNLMNNWVDCDPRDPKNIRMRTSAWVEHNGKRFLIDTSPDLRAQLHQHKISGIKPDAILYTHTHADHCHGIDDLRSYFWPEKNMINVYGHADHMAELERRFDYLFFGTTTNPLYANPILKTNMLLPGKTNFSGENIQVIEMTHGDTPCYGYRFGDIAWCTDFKSITPQGMADLAGVKTWFAAVSDWTEPHPSHAILSEVLALSEALGRPRTYLIHLNPRLDFAVLDAATPPHVSPAYDGLISAGG